MAGRVDPFLNCRFRVEIDGITVAGFSEVTGLEATVDTVDYREGTDNKNSRKLNGMVKYSNITLKRGITDNMELYNWFKEAFNGEALRKSFSIILVDIAGNDKARWEISLGWPIKYKAPDFNAKNNEVGIESVEIVHEGIRRV